MKQIVQTIATDGVGLIEFTGKVREFVRDSGADHGLLTLFCRHTSCSLLIQENADPDVQSDLLSYFRRLVPDGNDRTMQWLTHVAEGPDDMPAHIKAALLPVSLQIPISYGRLMLGTWQGIYLFEHRAMPHRRQIVLQLN